MTDDEAHRRILRRDAIGRLRDADSILRDAELTRQRSQESAAKLEEDIISEARLRAMQEAARTASRVLVEAEQAAEARMKSMEPELARLVAQTVRAILGEFEPEEASYLAARQALSQMRDHRKGRIFASADMVQPVRRAVEELGPDGPEILTIAADAALEDGVAILSSERGSAEIGLSALTDQALKAWDEQAEQAPPKDEDQE